MCTSFGDQTRPYTVMRSLLCLEAGLFAMLGRIAVNVIMTLLYASLKISLVLCLLLFNSNFVIDFCYLWYTKGT